MAKNSAKRPTKRRTSKSRKERPTDAELSILGVLWERGDSTVREVLEHLSEPEGQNASVGYTTVLKLLQIMTDKGLVTRDTSQHRHVFRAAHDQDATQRSLVRDLMNRAFAGSSQQLILQALSERPATETELDQIESMIQKMREERDRDR